MKRTILLSLVAVLLTVGPATTLAQEGRCTVSGECTVGADGTVDCSLELTGELTGECPLPPDSECTLSGDGSLKCTPVAEEGAPPEGRIEGGEVVTLDDGTQVYEYHYTPVASPGSPKFIDKKRLAVATAVSEFVELDPRPVRMSVMPLNSAGNEIAAEAVFIDSDSVAAIAGLDAGAITVPEAGKALILFENWIGGTSSRVDVAGISTDVPAKAGDTPGRAFVPLEPGKFEVVLYAEDVEPAKFEVELAAGQILALPLSLEGY